MPSPGVRCAHPPRTCLSSIFLASCAAIAVVSCGGGGGGDIAPPTPLPPPPVSIDLAVTGMDVIKVRAGAQGVTVMEERLTSLTEPGPDGGMPVLDKRRAVSGRCSAPSGWAIIDFAQHPSGEISVGLATARTVRLVRVDRAGAVRNDFALTDGDAPTDPFYDHGGVRDDGS